MVSDADIVRRLASFLRKADLSTTTTGVVRKHLEKELGVDLTDRKLFIREQVDLYLEKHQQPEEEEDDDEAQEQKEFRVKTEDGAEDGEEQEEEEEEEEEEEQEEEKPTRRTRQSDAEPDSKRFKAKIDRAIKASLPKEKKKRAGGGGGLNKVCGLSPELQAIIGEAELPRTQVVKQLWVYIREKELQDPDNKRKILCNDELRGLFGVDSTDIFKMNKLLSRHIWPLDKAASGEEDRKVKKQKTEKPPAERPKTEKKEDVKPKIEKKESGRGRGNGLSPLSEKLIEFLGTDETEMAQTDVVKHIWDYIGDHRLQDAADKRTIICDEKLQDLFGCETFVGFALTKLIAPHLKG
ncbi:hypothetical protein Mapa_010973 [Marchantia paleacea]|nr:hypothetical protein Mapa_010973 [Marchantia paleacea]